MFEKPCTACRRGVGIGRFMNAVTGGKSRLLCPHCGQVLKRDISLFTGLFYFGFASIFLPVLIIFGLGKNVGGRSLERIQKIFEVDTNTAFLIGIGILLGFFVAFVGLAALAYLRIEFDRDD